MRNRWFAVLSFVLLTTAILGFGPAVAFAVAPANNAFASATNLTPVASGSIAGDNREATIEPGEVPIDSETRSLWYKWTASADDVVSFDTNGSYDPLVGASEAIATSVRAYGPYGAGVPAIGVLTQVPETTRLADLLPSDHIVFPVTAGQTYYISITSPVMALPGITALNWHTLGNTGHITGTVTATNGGTLLPGIRVDAYLVGGNGNSLRTVRTNASGFYDLTGLGTGSYRMRFTDDSVSHTYLTEWFDNKLTEAASTPVAVTNGSLTSGKNSILDRASSISGTVRINGNPTQDVLVLLLSYSNNVADPNSPMTMTNASGGYSFTGLYPKVGTGNYYVVQFVEPFASGLSTIFYNQKTTPALADKLQPAEGTGLTTIDGSWSTLAPGTLSGAVTSGGVGLAGVTVSVPGNGSTTTAANGSYTLAGITPGTYTATYSKAGYVTQTPSVTIAAGGTLTKNVTLVQNPGTLSGTVTSSTVGIAGVTVSVPGNGSTTTAANGAYTLAGITPGTYTATYSKAGYVTQTPSVTITSGGTLTKDIAMVLAPVVPGTLAGIVTSGGSPLSGVTVSVPGNGSTTTAANGTYTLAGITPGTYTATYSKAGYVTQTPSVTIASGGTLTKNIVLVQNPGTLAGTVTSSTVGLSGVTVSVPGNGSTTTAANGTYTLAGIKPGTYTATYSKASYVTVTKSVTIAADATFPQDVEMVWTSSVPVTVWRFRYTSMVGNYLWTSDPAERDTIKATLAGTWAYEGPAFSFNSANPVNVDTMWRFKNKRIWSYFYTADPAERAAIQADPNSIWQYEGPTTIKISRKIATPYPVWRFQCLKNPTYLWTADPNEKNAIDKDLKADYKLEGVAYYLGK